jgi:hypothetical protein
MHLARNLIGQDLTFPAFEGVGRRIAMASKLSVMGVFPLSGRPQD